MVNMKRSKPSEESKQKGLLKISQFFKRPKSDELFSKPTHESEVLCSVRVEESIYDNPSPGPSSSCKSLSLSSPSNISRPISSLKTKVLHSTQDDPLPGPSSLKPILTTTNKSRPISALDNVASYICVETSPHINVGLHEHNISNEKVKKRSYGQRYLNSWEKMPEFKGWLSKSNKNSPHGVEMAFCKVCDHTLVCGKSELLRHAKTAKHIAFMSSVKLNKDVREWSNLPFILKLDEVSLSGLLC